MNMRPTTEAIHNISHDTLNLNITCNEAGSFQQRASVAPACGRGTPANGEQIEKTMPGCQRLSTRDLHQETHATKLDPLSEFDNFFNNQAPTNHIEDDSYAQAVMRPATQPTSDDMHNSDAPPPIQCHCPAGNWEYLRETKKLS